MKRRKLKSWVEKTLVSVFIINLMLVVGLEDFDFSIQTLSVIGLMIGNLFLIGSILAKYGSFNYINN